MGDRKQPAPPPTDQVKPDPPPAPPRNDDTHGDKLLAFTSTVDAIAPLSRSDRLDVLRAVAQFCGLVIPMDVPR